jgi:hypothetical protein
MIESVEADLESEGFPAGVRKEAQGKLQTVVPGLYPQRIADACGIPAKLDVLEYRSGDF